MWRAEPCSVGRQGKSFVWSKLKIVAAWKGVQAAKEALVRDQEGQIYIPTHLPGFALGCDAVARSFGLCIAGSYLGIWWFSGRFFYCFVFQGTESIYQLRKPAGRCYYRFCWLSCISCMKGFWESSHRGKRNLGPGCSAFLILPTAHRACYNCRE